MTTPVTKTSIAYTGLGATIGDTILVNYDFAFGIPEFATLTVYEESDPNTTLTYVLEMEGFIRITQNGTTPTNGTFVLELDVPRDAFVRSITNGNIFKEVTLKDLFTQALMVSGAVSEGRLTTLADSLNMGQNKIFNLGDPTDPQDAVNKQTLDAYDTALRSTYLGDAQAARDAALAAQTAAETAQGLSETAKTASEAAQALSASARDTSTTQAGIAATQASISTTQAGIATAQAGNAAQSAVAANVAKIEWRGAWSSSTAYEARDTVSNGGSSWIAKRANTNVIPVVGDDWDQLAQKGTDGTGTGTMNGFTAGTGINGSDGSTVENGDTISLDFATQAEAEAGTNTTKAMNPQRVAQAIEASATGGVPVGSIHAFVTLASVPSDYLVLNGSSFSSVTYPDLFAVLGSTTLPDMRGEFPRAADLGRGVDAGRAVGSWQTDGIKSHSHSYSGAYSPDGQQRNSSGIRIMADGDDSYRTGSFTTANVTNGGINETRPRNIAWVYAIKAE